MYKLALPLPNPQLYRTAVLNYLHKKDWTVSLKIPMDSMVTTDDTICLLLFLAYAYLILIDWNNWLSYVM